MAELCSSCDACASRRMSSLYMSFMGLCSPGSGDRELGRVDGLVLGLERGDELGGRLAERTAEGDRVLRLDREDRGGERERGFALQCAEREQVGRGGGVLEVVGDGEDGGLVLRRLQL